MYGHINKITYLDKMDFSTLGLVNPLLLVSNFECFQSILFYEFYHMYVFVWVS